MARATLIHNTVAGDGHPTGGELRELIAKQGFRPATATPDDDLDAALADPGDLVVAAGGDGTVGHVAARLLGRDIPLAILPIGTANNLATSLGIVGPIDRLVQGWASAIRRPLNVARARGPWGERPFVESFGLGLFPHMMPVLSALKKEESGRLVRENRIRHDRQALARLIRQYAPREVDLRLDGNSVAGEYLMVEVMNAPMLGPQLRLAPNADPGDGWLEIVLVREEDRRGLVRWLDDGATGSPGLDVRIGRRVDLVWGGEPLHIDGETWADASSPFLSVNSVPEADHAPVHVELHPETVPVLVKDFPQKIVADLS